MKALRHYDIELKDVRFESFVELYQIFKEKYDGHVGPTLLYDGSDICGDVVIAFLSDKKDKEEDIKTTLNTLKYF